MPRLLSCRSLAALSAALLAACAEVPGGGVVMPRGPADGSDGTAGTGDPDPTGQDGDGDGDGDGTTPAGTTPAGTTPAGTTTGTSSDCPPGVICVDALPYVGSSSTTGMPSALDGYSCAATTDESGPEVVYRVTLAEEGLLAASLSDLPGDVDVDVHLLEELDAGACIDRGHWDSAALLPAGTYYVVVDSWVDASGTVFDGDYTLSLVETGYDDYAADGLASDVLSTALYAFDRAWQAGDTDHLEYGVIDFSLPSVVPRFFVVDLRAGELLFSELTSHGIGSQDPNDLTMADRFSNISGSNMSSIGLMRGAETFDGTHGYSLRLDGLEPGFDDNVRDRAIIVHSADYATQAFVNDYGYLGRSQGCPAVDPAVSDAMIDVLRDGGLLLSYYPDPTWLADSAYLR
ncbi:MAG: murein L,D-transpeptidase catalytic domain family protein [Myxococcota bacterium]